MKKKVHLTAVVFISIIVSALIFSCSAQQDSDLKGGDTMPCTDEAAGIYEKKNQFDLPFLESLTRHLLALGH